MQRGHSLLWCRCRVISFLTHEASAAQSVIKAPQPPLIHRPLQERKLKLIRKPV